MSDHRRERPGSLKPKGVDFPNIRTHVTKAETRRSNKGLPPFLRGNVHLYARLQEYREDRWLKLVSAYEANPREFYNAYRWLNEHPVFYTFPYRMGQDLPQHERYLQDDRGMYEGIEFTVVRVDPKTEAISEDQALNTEVRFWYEICLGQFNSPFRLHDTDLDNGAKTYEKAVVKAARAVHKRYGNDRKKLEEEGR